MNTDPAALFKAYDIRGISPQEIDSAFAARFGHALAAMYRPKHVLVGRDMRVTSQELEDALVEALVASGANVTKIGLCSTPMFNVLTTLKANEYDLGVMITASHNPGKYNGFKITLGNGLPVGLGSGMEEVRDAFLASKQSLSETKGMVNEDTNALQKYLDKVISLAKLSMDMPPMKIAIDAGNGMSGGVIPSLLAKLPWLHSDNLYFELDGNFPNHEANPLKTETLTKLSETVRSDICMMGVAFDGDADRIGFVDETGAPIPGDILTAFIGQELVSMAPGSMVHCDVRSSWAVREAIEAAGGTFSFCRVGHAYIKELMRETGAIFAGELSMHFYYRELGNFESGDYTMLLMLRRLAREQKPLSELVAPLLTYAKSLEMNFEVKDPQAKIAELRSAYESSASMVLDMDGIRMEFRNPSDPASDWWFSVRASNTEPLLRLNVEARTKEELAKRIEEMKSRIQTT